MENQDFKIDNAYHALHMDAAETTPHIIYGMSDIRHSDKLVMFRNDAFPSSSSSLISSSPSDSVLKIVFHDDTTRNLFCTHLADILLPVLRKQYGFQRIEGCVDPVSDTRISSINQHGSAVIWMGLINEHRVYTKDKSIRILNYMSLLDQNAIQKFMLRLPYARKTHIFFKDLISARPDLMSEKDVEYVAFEVMAFEKLVYATHLKHSRRIYHQIYGYFKTRSYHPRQDDASLYLYQYLGHNILDPHEEEDIGKTEHFTSVSPRQLSDPAIVYKVPLPLKMTGVYSRYNHLPIFDIEWPLVVLGLRLQRGDILHVFKQDSSIENGVFKVFSSRENDRSVRIAQVHYLEFLSSYVTIRSLRLDQRAYDIVISFQHPYVRQNLDIMQSGEICFLGDPFEMYGSIDDIDHKDDNLHIHLFDDEHVFRNDYECVGDSKKKSKFSCESTFDLDRREEKGKDVMNVWDRRCSSDADCPFLQKDAEGKIHGGCSKNGYCEMPFNVQRIGFQKYKIDDDSFPICHDCLDDMTDRQKMKACCKKRGGKNMFLFYIR